MHTSNVRQGLKSHYNVSEVLSFHIIMEKRSRNPVNPAFENSQAWVPFSLLGWRGRQNTKVETQGFFLTITHTLLKNNSFQTLSINTTIYIEKYIIEGSEN